MGSRAADASCRRSSAPIRVDQLEIIDYVAAWDIHHAAFQASSKGEDIIILSVGDPDFDLRQVAGVNGIVARSLHSPCQFEGQVRVHKELRHAIFWILLTWLSLAA